jgi:hypothetical protein
MPAFTPFREHPEELRRLSLPRNQPRRATQGSSAQTRIDAVDSWEAPRFFGASALLPPTIPIHMDPSSDSPSQLRGRDQRKPFASQVRSSAAECLTFEQTGRRAEGHEGCESGRDRSLRIVTRCGHRNASDTLLTDFWGNGQKRWVLIHSPIDPVDIVENPVVASG